MGVCSTDDLEWSPEASISLSSMKDEPFIVDLSMLILSL